MAKESKTKKKKHLKKTKNVEIDAKVLEELGGEQNDLELLGDLDEDDEVIDYVDDLEAEPIKRDELRAYIEKLGIPDQMVRVVEKMDADVEDSDEDADVKKEPEIQEEIPPDSESPSNVEPKKKDKKLKNKFKAEAEEEPEADSGEGRKEKKKKNKYRDHVQDGEVSSTTPGGAGDAGPSSSGILNIGFTRQHTARKHMVVKPGTKWNEYGLNDDPQPDSTPPADKVETLLEFTTTLLEEEVKIYRKHQESSKKSDVTWMRTVLATGTLQDKMAAWTLLIQEAPIHNVMSLELLVSMVVKKGRREAMLAMDTLKELFLSELIPDDRKLRTFDQHPLSQLEAMASGNKDSRDKRLILWFYEHTLKKKYAEFVDGLETLCHDNIREVKQKAISTTFALLAGKPEQEKKLLTIIVNKLGDPDYKVASNAAHQLSNLVERHPNMKQIIIAEVERLMYRPNMAHKAQYYAVCFLNQVLLSKKDTQLALRLINIYFSFFKAFVKKGEVDGKMLSALLTGVNRAYPYAKDEQTKISEQMDTLYKVVHIVNFNTSVQALMLLYQVVDSSENTSDRYYQALYRKLLDPGLVTSSKQSMFLNLVYKSLKKDTVDRRIKAFIKRLLQVCSSLPPPFICGCLILLSEVLKTKPSVFQFTQMCQESDDEEEHFHDAPEEDEEDDSAERKQDKDTQNALGHVGHTTVSSWIHRKNIIGGDACESYDPCHRNPLYCRADTECVWEVERLCHHYHPTVAMFAAAILSGEGVNYSGDPLEDFTLIRFLDRFVYRNPKKREKEKEGVKGYERLQPRHKHQVAPGVGSVAVNTEQYVQADITDIPVHEKFFHKYFSELARKRAMKEEAENSGSEVDDDDFDNFLDDYEKGFDGADFKMDIAGEFTKQKAKKPGKKANDEDEDEDLSDEEIDFGADFAAEFGDDDEDGPMELGEGSEDDDVELDGDDDDDLDMSDDDLDMDDDDLDEEAVAFSDEDDPQTPDRKRAKKSVNPADEGFFVGGAPLSKKKKRNQDDEFDPSKLFAAAEEFADMMDDNVSSNVTDIGSEALSNNDKSHAKQLRWEQDRDKFVRGQDWKTRKRSQSRAPKHGGPKHGGPKHGGPKHGGPKHGGPKHGGPKHGGPKQAGFKGGKKGGVKGSKLSKPKGKGGKKKKVPTATLR